MPQPFAEPASNDSPVATASGSGVALSVAGWLCLLAGAVGLAAVSMIDEALAMEQATRIERTKRAELTALEAEVEAWSQIEASLRTDPAFRIEWARLELPGLVSGPPGLPLPRASRVDLRRPVVATVSPEPPPAWRSDAAEVAAVPYLGLGCLLLTLLGVVSAEPQALVGGGPIAWARRRYRIDPAQPLRGWSRRFRQTDASR